MISKILKIEGLGKFKNFTSTNDDLRFLKHTIIFGYNSYGKSTLTTIFRSLQKSDLSLLNGKKSFNHLGEIIIDLLDEKNQHLTLKNGSWNNPNIAIFDNHFIHSSVFIGDEVDHRHKSSLHGIFIGENIKQKVDRLAVLRSEQDVLEKRRDFVKTKYTKNDLGTFDFFLKAKETKNVTDEIRQKEGEIQRLKNLAALKQLISVSPLATTFEKFFVSMHKTLDTSAEQNITEHIRNHWGDDKASRNFIADGVSLLKNDTNTCVFCGQNLKPVSELIADFKKVFGEVYAETRSEIEKYGEAFQRLDIEAEITKFIPLGIKCKEIFDETELMRCKQNIDEVIDKKLKDLNYKVDWSAGDSPFNMFINEIRKLHPIFEKLKTEEYSDLKEKCLENELSSLKLSQFRYSDEGKSLADEYQTGVNDVENKKTEINNLRKEIDEETQKAIEKNQKLINEILQDVLKANFKIQKLNSKSNLTRASSHFIEYEFVVDGTVVPLSNKRTQTDKEPLDKAFFGNTLSDSDKRVLAMAFFISSLRTDENLKDKIVVLDDPFSSFDSNRKDYLASSIIDIQNEKKEKPKQIIVLTHDDGFLSRLHQKLPSGNTKLLKIEYSKTNGSILEKCNIEQIIEEEYFKDIKYIKDSVDNSRNVNESLQKVRKCLERVLKHKYYFMLDTQTLQEGSITSYLDKIDNKCQVKNEILRSNWHEQMHDQHAIMKLDDPEKIQRLEDFLVLLEKI